MKCIYSLFLLFYFGNSCLGQYYIDTLTYQNDSLLRTKNYVAFTDSNFIYVFGENDYRKYSSSSIDPYWTKYDYNGNFVNQVVRYGQGGYEFGQNQVLSHKRNNRYYIFSEENSSDATTIRLAEINMETGKFNKNRLLTESTIDFAGYDGLNSILLLHRTGWFDRKTQDFIRQEYISSFDTNFIYQNGFRLWESAGDLSHVPWISYVKIMAGNQFLFLGTNFWVASNKEKIDSSGISKWLYNEFGQLLQLNMIPGGRNAEFRSHKSIIVDKLGNNILGVNKKWLDSTSNIKERVYYISSYNSNFDSLNWSILLIDAYGKSIHFSKLVALTASHDKKGYVGLLEWIDPDERTKNGCLVKVSNDGSLEWSRMVMPKSYQLKVDNALVFDHVTSSPYGYVIIGSYRKNKSKNVSFLLHLDKLGCETPGCQLIDYVENARNEQASNFEIFPNPVHDHLYILSKASAREKHIINLYNMKGDELLQSDFYPQRNAQIMLLLPGNIESGMHVLVIRDESGKSIWQKSVIIR